MNLSNLLCVFVLFSGFVSAQDLRRPNIIVMMADDMGLGDTSAYQDFTGNADDVQIHTPAMEVLARRGVRFTDAHTPSSRCSPTRYGLLTGRYPWRNRLKFWVLFGSQGDPMIERDRPTIASLLRDNGYGTAMVGKWHVGLRYQNAEGKAAAGFLDADLTRPLVDCPLDHGFQSCLFTSRSHGTSGAQPGRKNGPRQNIGPGHIEGRTCLSATGVGRRLVADGPNAYVLKELGGRHSDSTLSFLNQHVGDSQTSVKPFFLYYASNSNHAPYTADTEVGRVSVAGHGKYVDGQLTGPRGDFVYENDVALGRLIDWLEKTDDPRHSGSRLIQNTLVIFTSDNGAESKARRATGPFRSNKGSCYEGGHRVPFIASWPAGGIGDGNTHADGRTSSQLLCLTDLFATFADIIDVKLPRNRDGRKGAEDSVSVLSSLKESTTFARPLFVNDHKEAGEDAALAAFRLDDPVVSDRTWKGQWKILFDSQLLRVGRANPLELYELTTDLQETHNRVSDPELTPLVDALVRMAVDHRTVGGHRLAAASTSPPIVFDWQSTGERGKDSLAAEFSSSQMADRTVSVSGLTMHIEGQSVGHRETDQKFAVNSRGLGITGGKFDQVDSGEALLIRFDRDVVVESASIVAGNGVCGGYYQVGNGSRLAIYCVDADIDSKDQSGVLSDIGVLKAGSVLRLDSTPHYAAEASGRWRLQRLTVRILNSENADRRQQRPVRRS